MAMLPQLIPPFRYAIVEEFLYRGSYPTLKNYRFLRRLHLKTIVSLTPESQPNRDMRNFCEAEGIRNRHFYVGKFQDEVTISSAKVIQILQIMICPENLPLYLHCLDGTHVTGLVIMCFRKLQSWNLSTSAAEYCSFQKSGEISREESQFVEAFRGDIEIPHVIPNWLWQGVRTIRHPIFRLKVLPPGNVDLKDGEVVRGSKGNATNGLNSPSYWTVTLPYSGYLEDLAAKHLGMHHGSSGLVSLIKTTGHLGRSASSGQALSDMGEGGIIYTATEAQEQGQFQMDAANKGTGLFSIVGMRGDEGGLIQGETVCNAPTINSSNRSGSRTAKAVPRFSHDGWGVKYTERKHTLEALALEGLRLVGSSSRKPVKLPQLPRQPPPDISSHLLE